MKEACAQVVESAINAILLGLRDLVSHGGGGGQRRVTFTRSEEGYVPAYACTRRRRRNSNDTMSCNDDSVSDDRTATHHSAAIFPKTFFVVNHSAAFLPFALSDIPHCPWRCPTSFLLVSDLKMVPIQQSDTSGGQGAQFLRQPFSP